MAEAADDEEEVEIEMDGEDEEEMAYDGPEVAEAAAPKTPPEPVEPEQDDEKAALRPRSEVALSTVECTPDVSFSTAGIVSKLEQGAFAHLLSGVRATTGARGGRFLFEVRVLEEAAEAKQELRIGFSQAGSSLFLGDGSVEGVGFSLDGTYFMAEPGQLSSMHRPGACKPLNTGVVIGVVLNLDSSSSVPNTVSIFLDGVRAGPPQPVPHHLQGKGLFPTVTFRGFSLAVNLGQAGRQLKALPFRCCLLSQLDKENVVAAPSHATGASELIMPVALPDAGLFDFALRFREAHPEFLELSDGSFQEWCERSGVKRNRKPGDTHSRDEPDFSTGHDSIDDLSWQEALLRVAQCSDRSALAVGVRSGLLPAERKKLLARFPSTTKKVAVVLLGEPSAVFKQWVHDRVKNEYETKKALAEKRYLLAEASGVTIEENDNVLAAPPALDAASTRFLPRPDPFKDVPDVSAKTLATDFTQFCLPSEAEGFDEVRYEWLDKDAAEAYLRRWTQERKSEFVVEALKPGIWFQAKFDEWKEERKKLRKGHADFSERKKREPELGDDASVDLATVADIHNADGDGVPAYAHFKYEDWLLLSWRYEMHLLAHAFLEDAADSDLTGIPEGHVGHYFKLYYGQEFDPKGKIGADGLVKALKLLKEPLELVEVRPGHQVLKSKAERTAPLDSFVKGVELFRRDRQRRLDAGDESALLTFPRPQKVALAKAAVGKASPQPGASPGAAAGKGSGMGAGKSGAAGVPAKAAPAPARTPGPTQPIVKAPITKAAPRAVVVIAKQAVAKTPAKAAPLPIVKAPQGGNGAVLKRPLPPQGAPQHDDAKRPRPPGAPAQITKAPPIAKRRPM